MDVSNHGFQIFLTDFLDTTQNFREIDIIEKVFRNRVFGFWYVRLWVGSWVRARLRPWWVGSWVRARLRIWWVGFWVRTRLRPWWVGSWVRARLGIWRVGSWVRARLRTWWVGSWVRARLRPWWVGSWVRARLRIWWVGSWVREWGRLGSRLWLNYIRWTILSFIYGVPNHLSDLLRDEPHSILCAVAQNILTLALSIILRAFFAVL